MATNTRRNSRSNPLIGWLQSLSKSHSVFFLLAVPALAIGAISIVSDYFGTVRPGIAHYESLEFRAQLEAKLPSKIVGDFIWEQSMFLMFLLIPVFVMVILRWRKSISFIGVFLFFGLVTTAALGAEISKNWEAATVSYIGEEPSVMAYYVKLLLIAFSLMSPAIVLAYYKFAPTMDRYMMWNFASPFLLCLIGFVAIALLIDLTDNFADFAKSDSSMVVITMYYVTLLPQIIVMFTPIALLLSLLFTLSKMSRANEIISMLGTGRSMMSVLKPVFFVGIVTSVICMALSYYWAPRSVGATEAMIEAINNNEEPDSMATRQPYVNKEEGRAWYIGRIPFDLINDKMRGIEIYGTDEQGRLNKVWLAKSARWWKGGTWTLYHGNVIEFDENQIAVSMTEFDGEGGLEDPDRLDVQWDETPWQLIGQTFRPDFLSVPDLGSYIRANETVRNGLEMAPFRTYWHYNLALPWTCLVVVLIAAPLGIVYSRRGVLGGVAASILIFFGIMVVDNLFLNMGKFDTISPFYAAWMPRFIFGGLGLCILAFRARNRELPKLNPFHWYRNYRAAHST